jgi:hypothetical protein
LLTRESRVLANGWTRPSSMTIFVNLFIRGTVSSEELQEWHKTPYTNVRREPVFSVMAAGCICEKSGWLGKVEDVKLVLFEKKLDFNWQPFWGGGFLPGWIMKHVDFIRFDSYRVGYHLVLGFR